MFLSLIAWGMPLVASPIRVVASIPVIGRLAQDIASTDVQVTVLTHPGGSAHVFEPSADQIAQIRRADVFFALPSLSHERGYLQRIQRLNKQLHIVSLETPLPKTFVMDSLAHDPHRWMAPVLLCEMVRVMVTTLSQKNPAHASLYQKRGQDVIAVFMAEDRRMRASFSGLQNKAFLTYHPSFGYFAQSYGLSQYALEREGKSLSAAYFRRIILEARKAGVQVFLIHPGLDAVMVSRVIDETKAQPVTVDVLDPDIVKVWHQLSLALARK